jgi:hypothetical protein
VVPTESTDPNKIEPWVKLLTATFVLVVTVLGIYKGCASNNETNSPQSAGAGRATQSFSGIVVDENGKPVSGASVQVTVDQQAPVPYTSDSLGAFELQIPIHTSTIRINVYMNGFKARSLLDSPQRTGPEVIVLTHTPPSAQLKAPRSGRPIPRGGKTSIVIGHDNEVNQ